MLYTTTAPLKIKISKAVFLLNLVGLNVTLQIAFLIPNLGSKVAEVASFV